MGVKEDITVALYGSTKMVLKEYVENITVKFGEVTIGTSQTRPIIVKGCASLITLVGEVKGKVLVDLPLETALKISSVMNEEEIPEFNDTVSMTINELANMIVGNAINRLVDAGVDVDISIPSFIYGKEIALYSSEASDILVVPVETSLGDLFITISITTK